MPRKPSRGPTSIDTNPISAELQQALRLNPEHGMVVSRLASDGVERTRAYRRVEGRPFMVLAGLDNERFFAPWRGQVRQVSLLALQRVADVDGELFIFSSFRAVTERKRLLASIESSAAQIRDLYDNAPCGDHSLGTRPATRPRA